MKHPLLLYPVGGNCDIRVKHMAMSEQFPTMSTPAVKQRRFPLFLLSSAIFLSVAPMVLWLADLFSIRTYFIVSFTWLLISSEVFAPADPEMVWWHRLQWVKVAGWLVLVFIVFERVVAAVG